MLKLDSGFFKRIEEITIPFLARLATTRRAVGVPRSVNTVSKFTVSREKVRISDEEVLTLSLMQELTHTLIAAINVKRIKKAFLIYEKRFCDVDIIVGVRNSDLGIRSYGHFSLLTSHFSLISDNMKYMMIAGEASGDLHASNVIQSLKKLDKDADIRFFGGDLMAKAAGRLPELHYERMNVMGFSEVIRKFSVIMKNFALARKVLREFRPDVLVLIDYPGFNLRMAKYAHKLGIPVHYFISPKVWAWKEWRVKKIKKYVDKMYSILPFEVAFYKNHHYDVTYVGNPSVQEIAYSLGHIPPKKHFMERQGITDPRPIIALLPGSRSSEIRNNLPLMIAAAKRFPEFQYMVGAAPAVPEKFYREVAQDPGLKVIFGATHTLLKYSAAAVVTSGTATLETALIGTPQVVVYRSNGMKLSYKIMEKLLKIKYVSLPNLIVNNSVVSELLLHECTVEGIARELSPLLQPSPRRSSQLAGYKTMQRKLGNFVASEYVAELIVDTLGVQPATDNGSESPKKATKASAESSGKSSAEDSGEQKPRPRRRKPKPKSDPQPEE